MTETMEKPERKVNTKSKEVLHKPLLFYYDCEAATSSLFKGDIIEIAARVDEDVCSGSSFFKSLICTTQELSWFAVEKCGITKDDLVGQPNFADVFSKFIKWVQNIVKKVNRKNTVEYFPVICAHGGFSFDFTMLLANMDRCGVNEKVLTKSNLHFADTFNLCKELQAENKCTELCGIKLSMDALFNKFCPGETFLERHRAMGDVDAMVKIFAKEPLQKWTKNMHYVASEALCDMYHKQRSLKTQQLIWAEKMTKLDAYTKCVNLKKLTHIQMTYEEMQCLFESCCSFMDFYQTMKDRGIDRKTAKHFACQFGGIGLINQGVVPYSRAVDVDKESDLVGTELDLTVDPELFYTKQVFVRPTNVPEVPQSDFIGEPLECWDDELDDTRSFVLKFDKPDTPLSITMDDIVLVTKKSKKERKTSRKKQNTVHHSSDQRSDVDKTEVKSQVKNDKTGVKIATENGEGDLSSDIKSKHEKGNTGQHEKNTRQTVHLKNKGISSVKTQKKDDKKKNSVLEYESKNTNETSDHATEKAKENFCEEFQASNGVKQQKSNKEKAKIVTQTTNTSSENVLTRNLGRNTKIRPRLAKSEEQIMKLEQQSQEQKTKTIPPIDKQTNSGQNVSTNNVIRKRDQTKSKIDRYDSEKNDPKSKEIPGKDSQSRNERENSSRENEKKCSKEVETRNRRGSLEQQVKSKNNKSLKQQPNNTNSKEIPGRIRIIKREDGNSLKTETMEQNLSQGIPKKSNLGIWGKQVNCLTNSVVTRTANSDGNCLKNPKKPTVYKNTNVEKTKLSRFTECDALKTDQDSTKQPIPDAVVVFVNTKKDRHQKHWPRVTIWIGDIPINVSVAPSVATCSEITVAKRQRPVVSGKPVAKQQQTNVAKEPSQNKPEPTVARQPTHYVAGQPKTEKPEHRVAIGPEKSVSPGPVESVARQQDRSVARQQELSVARQHGLDFAGQYELGFAGQPELGVARQPECSVARQLELDVARQPENDVSGQSVVNDNTAVCSDADRNQHTSCAQASYFEDENRCIYSTVNGRDSEMLLHSNGYPGQSERPFCNEPNCYQCFIASGIPSPTSVHQAYENQFNQSNPTDHFNTYVDTRERSDVIPWQYYPHQNYPYYNPNVPYCIPVFSRSRPSVPYE